MVQRSSVAALWIGLVLVATAVAAATGQPAAGACEPSGQQQGVGPDRSVDQDRSVEPSVDQGRSVEPSVDQGRSVEPSVDRDEHAARRQRAMARLDDGILLLHARSGPKAEDQPRFNQDASFFYFTGLSAAPGAVLALDGRRDEAWLFVAPAPMSFGRRVEGLAPEPGEASARRLRLTGVADADGFVDWLRERLSADPETILYVDAPRRPEITGAPAGMPPLAGPLALWHRALEQTFPAARLEPAVDVIRQLRWVKSAGEVEMLRDNARATVQALRAAARRIGPGVTQRQAEAAVVATCLEAGAQGPSFWPWTMSGPNAGVDRLVRAFYSYEHLDRTMQEGELVRVDIGCAAHGYGADVGRTLPVSGRFDEVQGEVWELLVAGYLAGVEAMAAEVQVDAVRAASRARIRELEPGLRSDAARGAARILDDDSAWHVHGVGVESGEEALPVLRRGSVLAYEPMVEVGDDAFYLEDMILVTESGHEILSAGLPYSAEEIAALMAGAGPE